MSLFQHKSEDVERYLDALRCDPHAVPPQDLDPETAAIIRAVVQLHSLPDQEAETETLLVEQRVWDRVMFGILAPPNLKPNYLSGEYAPKIITFPQPEGDQHVDHDAADAFTSHRELAGQPLSAEPPLKILQRKERMRLSFVAAMLVAVFCLTGLLLEYDVLTNDYLRYTPSLKTQTTIPTLDSDTSAEQNPQFFSRIQRDSTTWESAPELEPAEQEESETVALNIPISPKKQFPDLVGEQQ